MAKPTDPRVSTVPSLRYTRCLSAEATRRSLAGQPREEILAVLAAEAAAAFDLLEPSLGRYLIRPA